MNDIPNLRREVCGESAPQAAGKKNPVIHPPDGRATRHSRRGGFACHHYAKMGTMREAQGALQDTREPNVVSYTALIAGLLKNRKQTVCSGACQRGT